MDRSRFLPCLAALYIGTMAMPATTAIAQDMISSYAFVREDGALEIDGRLVHLYGIYIPPTDRTCHTFIRPLRCSSRAALALDFRISGDFVRCLPRFANPDGSLVASCTSGDEDLSEWMLQKGWALARPDAPFSYIALERIAQARGFGVWGIPIEIHRRKH